MNEGHIVYLSSPEWRTYLAAEILPWAIADVPSRGRVLEVGPGPGLMTDLLREVVDEVVAVEIDPALAEPLARRLAGMNVEVVCADAAATGLPADHVDTVTCFTMLHHVPTPEHQDRLFAEACRVLRPGGALVGTDSTDDPDLRRFHADDVFVPVDPATLPQRLRTAGFTDVTVETWVSDARIGEKVRFRAVKPI